MTFAGAAVEVTEEPRFQPCPDLCDEAFSPWYGEDGRDLGLDDLDDWKVERLIVVLTLPRDRAAFWSAAPRFLRPGIIRLMDLNLRVLC